MAKKKREPGKKKPKPARPGDLPDRRGMEATLQQLVAQLQGQPHQESPLGKAQEIMYRAFDEPDKQRRIRFAKQALEICPDCADAHVLLAENASNRKETLRQYELGVAAGERALGPTGFQQNAGHFWGVLETRPYMRARLGLAIALWTAVRRDEAVQHLQEMLKLNPNDNQGVRYTLAGFLCFLDRDDEVARLLQQFPNEGSSTWAFTKALLAFRKQGDTPESQRLIADAKKMNEHIPGYFLGDVLPPAQEPGYYSPGDQNEAFDYMRGFLPAWRSTPGAIDWLRASVKKPKESIRAKGPLGFIKNWLVKKLPQEYDIWQADVLQMPNWIHIGDESVRIWAILVTTRSNDLVLAHKVSEEPPTAALVWDTLVEAMRHPLAGEPHRPTELQVRDRDCWKSLRPHLEEIGLQMTVCEELELLDDAFKGMSEQVCGKPKPGLLDMPGMNADQVGRFYEAAAHFFRMSPWKKIGHEAAIKIECDKYQSGPWYAVVMGLSGLSLGLALFEDLRLLQRMWTGNMSDGESGRQTVATTVTFGEEFECPIADLDACKKFGWQVARSDAYPEIVHKERGMSVRPPLAWELELMEGCLRAVPDFIERRKQDDPAKESITVPVASGELNLKLSWVVEES